MYRYTQTVPARAIPVFSVFIPFFGCPRRCVFCSQHGGEERTTNNRMELSGAIAGLAALKERCHVTLYSDSKYLIDALQKGWAVGWRARGWKKSDGKPALNPDLWERLLGLMERHEVETVWVKGHAGHAYNERCDALAVSAAEACKKH